MNAPTSDNSRVPAAVAEKLEAVRRHARQIHFGTGLWRGAAILLAAMMAAMAIDWLAVLYSPLWRWTLTLAAVAGGVAGFVFFGLLPMRRARSSAAFAEDIDRTHPAFEERCLTVTEFARDKDAAELQGSQGMIHKVAEEAAALSREIVPGLVISRAGLVRARKELCIALGVLAVFFLIDFSRAKILCERFWAPGADFSLTRLQAKPGNVVVGKGESVTVEFVPTGKLREAASLFVRSAKGGTEVIPLKLMPAPGSKFVYNWSAVGETFDYRARSGDGQTAWHRVTVVERPSLAQVKVRLVPPAYSRLPATEEQTLPRQLRALEGSRMEVTFRADQPLASLNLRFGDAKVVPLAPAADKTYRFETVLSNSLTFTPELTNLYHLDNLPKPTCEMTVFKDEPPTVKVISPTDEITARPDDKLKIDFEASDDFGIASAKLIVMTKTDTNVATFEMPIPLKEQTGAKQVRKQVELDLAPFHLKQDQELSYVVQVTDTKDNNSMASPGASGDSNTNLMAEAESPDSAKAQQPSAQSAAQPSAEDNKDAKNGKDGKSDQPSAGNPKEGKSGIPSKLTAAANPAKPSTDSQGSQRPPDDMTRRVMDVGQCSSCQPQRVLVDEWGRSFEGQAREKLEIAIDPILKKLDALLATAQTGTETTRREAQASPGSQPSAPLENAREQLSQADATVTDLKSKSQDTPYAFIGLQLHDVRVAHISPARQELGGVALESAKAKEDLAHLDQADFQIQRAREKLADLARSYETVKRDYKLADATQRLKKMHQIFLEDTQAMLGAKKPTLNPMDRKVAEVDDEFSDKLQKLLEEKKKIMAELAKILADDPRLLRRFLAAEQLEGTTLRDQMTLLAERQKALAQTGTEWSALPEADRAARLKQMVASQAAEQAEVSALATAMNENMLTWLPKDVPPEQPQVAACRTLANESARLMGEAARQAASPDTMNGSLDAGLKALDQLRLLQARLPELDQAAGANGRLSLYAANRLSETSTLITRESGWISKVIALQQGDYAHAAEVDQHRLAVDTTELHEKMETATTAFGQLSVEIRAKADELNGTVRKQILPEQNVATDEFAKKSVPPGVAHQAKATEAFAKAEAQFDDLLHMIIAKLDAAPPPNSVPPNKSLEELLAELEDEQKAAEKLGVPCRPLNVSILRDWMKPGSNPGSGMGSARGQQARAEARSAQSQARQSADKAQRASLQAKSQAQKLAAELAGGPVEGNAVTGPKRPPKSWNTVVSQLGDELRQGRDNVPPEQYRQAIEYYFNTISQVTPASGVSTNSR